MGKTNRAWHAAHKMPANASTEQRLQWHLAHAAHCACRPVPAGLVAEMKARNIEIPSRREDDAAA